MWGDGARHCNRRRSRRRVSTPGPAVVPRTSLPSADVHPDDEDDVQYSPGAHPVDDLSACATDNFGVNDIRGADALSDIHDAPSDDIDV